MSSFVIFVEWFNSIGDDGLPFKLSIGSCTYCENFIFMSETEKTRHMALLHHDKKGNIREVC